MNLFKMAAVSFKIFRNLLAKAYATIFSEHIDSIVANKCVGCTNVTVAHSVCLYDTEDKLRSCLPELLYCTSSAEVTEQLIQNVKNLGLNSDEIPDMFLFPHIRGELFKDNNDELKHVWITMIAEYMDGNCLNNYIV